LAASHHIKGEDDIVSVGVVEWSNSYEIFECCGCETVKFRAREWWSEDPDEVKTAVFPPDVSRKKPRWIWHLPIEMRDLMEEIYGALHANSRRLAAMGARTILDLVIIQKVGHQNTFGDGLQN
jgi:hypothetical protein